MDYGLVRLLSEARYSLLSGMVNEGPFGSFTFLKYFENTTVSKNI